MSHINFHKRLTMPSLYIIYLSHDFYGILRAVCAKSFMFKLDKLGLISGIQGCTRQPSPVRWPLAITFITRQACACIRTLCVPLCLSVCLSFSLCLCLSLSHTHKAHTNTYLHTLMYHAYEYKHPLLYKDVQKYANTLTQYTHTHTHTHSHIQR